LEKEKEQPTEVAAVVVVAVAVAVAALPDANEKNSKKMKILCDALRWKLCKNYVQNSNWILSDIV